jgi:hypothetical protein
MHCVTLRIHKKVLFGKILNLTPVPLKKNQVSLIP